MRFLVLAAMVLGLVPSLSWAQQPVQSARLEQLLSNHTIEGSLTSPGGSMTFLWYLSPDHQGIEVDAADGVPTRWHITQWSTPQDGTLCRSRAPWSGGPVAPVRCVSISRLPNAILEMQYPGPAGTQVVPILLHPGNMLGASP